MLFMIEFEQSFEIHVEARQALNEIVQDNIANKVIIFFSKLEMLLSWFEIQVLLMSRVMSRPVISCS